MSADAWSKYPPFTHTPGSRSNWKRLLCWWWGHEYWTVRGLLYNDPNLVCLRCYCSTPLCPEGCGGHA